MNKTFAFLISSAVIILLNISSFAVHVRAAEYVPGEILIKYRDRNDATGTNSVNSLNTRLGTVKKKFFKKVKIHQVKLPPGMSVEEAVEYYNQDPDVEFAEPNYIVHATITPDDSSFNKLWGLHNRGQRVKGSKGKKDSDIDAPKAWNETTGSSDVIIAVIDSGVDYNHPDLGANIWTNPNESPGDANGDMAPGVLGIDDDGDGLIDEDSQGNEPGDPGYKNDLDDDDDENGYADDMQGWDFVDEDNDPMDYASHGTHVAGTIAAVGDNSNGITGVLWNASIMPVRSLDATGSGSTADAIEAILYANANGAHVINNSWGGRGSSKSLKAAIAASEAVVVCAAGNDGADNDKIPQYPSSYNSSNIIAVAATSSKDRLATFSNYGDKSVDVAAPGVKIYSTVPARELVLSDNFDDGDLLSPDWTTGGTSDWDISTLFSESGSYSLADSTGNYANNADSWVQTAAFSLIGKMGCKILYNLKLDALPDDLFHIEASDDSVNWTTLNSYSGSTFGYFFELIDDLTSFDGMGTVYVRYRMETDASKTADGAFIDDFKVTCASSTYDGSEYEYFNGTSMAAPHVSGIAGLIKASVPRLSNEDIIDAILNSVDVNCLYDDKIATLGRVNAYKALLLAQGDSDGLTAGESVCKVVPKRFRKQRGEDKGSKGGRCFVATAAYGSIMHPYVKALRTFRDKHLLTNSMGRAFVNLYYKYSPPLADIIRDSETLRFSSRVLLSPLVLAVVFPAESLGLLFVFLGVSVVVFRKRGKQK